MHIGILGGTGPAGRAVAARLASVGLEVTIGSRSKDRATEICGRIKDRWPGLKLALRPGDNEDAAAADLIIVATPWDSAASTAASVAARLDEKVVVSMANAIARLGDEFICLIPPRGSIAAGVQAALPFARVSAALHHVPARHLAQLDAGLDCDVLICSDYADAAEATAALIQRVPGLRALDAGRLSSAGPIETLTPVLLHLNNRYKTQASIRFRDIDLG